MKKIVIGIVVLFVIVLAAAIAIPYFLKDEILVAFNQELSKELNATINIKDVDVSLLKNIKSFLDVSLVVEGLTVVGKNDFEGDTLVNAEEILLTLDIKSVIDGTDMKIHSAILNNADINAIVNKDGLANWDITKEEDNKDEKSKFQLALNHIELNNINVKYSDIGAGQELKIQNLNHSANGDFSDKIFDYESKTDIEGLNFWEKNIPMLKDVHFANESKINVDNETNKISFKDNEMKLNDLVLVLNGMVKNNDDKSTYLDLNFASENNDFKSVLSLVPAIYQKDFNDVETSGKFDIKGIVTGLYKNDIYPKMDIAFNVANGEFHYPGLPKKVSNIQVQSLIKSQGGSMDNIVFDVPKFSMNLGGAPFVGKLKLSNMKTNPKFEVYTKGDINLADVNSFYPLEGVKKLVGMMHLDLNIKASQADVKSKNYKAINASGEASIKGLEYESESIEKPMTINDITLNFSPRYVDVPHCDGSLGSMDFKAKAKLENFLGYYLDENEVMKGTLDFYSHKINANEFISGEDESSSGEFVMVPDMVDFTGKIKVDEFIYGDMNMKNLSGQMTVKDEKVTLKNVAANLLGGDATLDAVYSTVGKNKPTSTVKYNANSFDMKEVFAHVESAQKIAPILEYMTGKLSSNSSLTMSLLPDMSPDLNTLNGDFNVTIPLAKVVDVPALKQIAELTKLKQLNNLEVQNINADMAFQNGRAIIEPFEFKAKDMNMKLGGSQGLDKSIDYRMAIDVPFSKLGNASSVVNGLLDKFNIPILGNIKPETIRLNLDIKGFFDNPKIKMAAPEILHNGSSEATTPDKVVIDEAKKQVEQVKEQAVKTVDSVKQEVKKEVEKKVDEVKKQAEKEVNKKKDELLNELKKKFPWK